MLGAGGLLGREIVARSTAAGLLPVGLDRAALDVLDEHAVDAVVQDVEPTVVINCAAWTAVDGAESSVAEALAVNGTAVQGIAEVCAKRRVPLVHVSTDHVFDGSAVTPYAEDAEPAPLNAYGRSKLVGERAVLQTLPATGYVLRTAWLYGRYGPSFVRTMARLASGHSTVDVVDDQRGQPTWARDVADLVIDVRRLGLPPGVYHATNGGDATWYELARTVFRLVGADPVRVRAISTAQRGCPAPRPHYSALGHDRWRTVGLAAPRHWQAALTEAFPDVLAGMA